jgi:hypothetical protein
MPKARNVSQGRIKERYNPTPTPAEKDHHLRVMSHGCMVCGGDAVFHHLLQRSVHKRWRRDHRIGVPLCHDHHSELHDVIGGDMKFGDKYGLDLENAARFFELESITEGIL